MRTVRNHIAKRRTGLDEGYFKVIDSYEKAYFLGLLMADGCVFKNRLSLSLKESDSYMIEKFKKAIGYTGRTTIKSSIVNGGVFKAASVQVYSIDMVSDLLKYGLTENKSLTLKFPTNIPSVYLWSFVRGYFDGDGWIVRVLRKGKYWYNQLGLIGSIDFCNHFLSILKKIEISATTIIKNDKFMEIVVTRRSSIDLIRKLMYENDTISLIRKKERFLISNPNN